MGWLPLTHNFTGGVRVKASEPKAASWLHSDAAAGTALRAATARAHHAGEA